MGNLVFKKGPGVGEADPRAAHVPDAQRLWGFWLFMAKNPAARVRESPSPRGGFLSKNFLTKNPD